MPIKGLHAECEEAQCCLVCNREIVHVDRAHTYHLLVIFLLGGFSGRFGG